MHSITDPLDPTLVVITELIAERQSLLNEDQFILAFIGELESRLMLSKVFTEGDKPIEDYPVLLRYYSLYSKKDKELRNNHSATLFGMQNAMNYFNRMYAKVVMGGKVVVLDRDLTGGIKAYDKKQFFDMFTRIMIDAGRDVSANSAPRYWFNHTHTYLSVVFNPTPTYQPSPTEFNLWQGFRFKAESTSQSVGFRSFIYNVICAKDRDSYNYLLDLMARIVQHPETKVGEGVAVALQGSQGSGKNFFIESFGKLFGEAYTKVDDTTQLTRNFNSNLLNKILVFGDEAVWGGDKRSRSMLKSLVTSDTIPIEIKYLDPFVAPNYIRLFTATNDDWAAPKEFGDRRWFVLRVSDCHRRDSRYFSRIAQQLENGGFEDLMYELLKRDVMSRNFQNTMPTTKAAFDSLQSSLEPDEQVIYEMLISGYFGQGDYVSAFGVAVDKLFEVYKSYLKEHKISYMKTRARFGMTINRLIPSVIRFKRTVDEGIRYFYRFPDLAIARQEFSKGAGIEIDWDSVSTIYDQDRLYYSEITKQYEKIEIAERSTFVTSLKADAVKMLTGEYAVSGELAPLYQYFLYCTLDNVREVNLFKFRETISNAVRDEFALQPDDPNLPQVRAIGKLRSIVWYSYAKCSGKELSSLFPESVFAVDINTCLVPKDFANARVIAKDDKSVEYNYQGKLTSTVFQPLWEIVVELVGTKSDRHFEIRERPVAERESK